jgi:tetratricopeptide (TPR) repeat protein
MRYAVDMRLPRLVGSLALALAIAGLARAQPTAAPPAAAPAAAPGTARSDGALPPIPAVAPDRFAVMAFENRSGVRVLDWAIAGLPLALAEKLERVSGLAPAYDAWVVPTGPPVPAEPSAVAAFAVARDARWVVTGWVRRPDWQLEVAVAVWRIEGGVATQVAERTARGPLEDPHAVLGAAAAGALTDATWRLPADAGTALAARPTDDPYAFTLLGRGLGRARGAWGPPDRAAAAADLARAVLVDPDLVAGQRLLGLLWSTDPDPAIAKKAAGKFAYAADLDPGYPAAVRAVAERAAVLGDWATAVERSRQLVLARPWDLDARVALGRAAWGHGDAALALAELGRVVAHRADDLAAHRVLAEIAAARGELPTQIAELEIVTRLAADDLAAWGELSAAYALAGRVVEATAAAERVAAARPTDAGAAKRVGDLYRQRGEVEPAVRWYDAAARLAPDDARPLLLAGATLLDAGRYPAARALLLRAQRSAALQVAAATALGAVAYLEGKPGEATQHWRRAATARPRSVALRYDLALAAAAAGDRARAERQLAVVERLAPGDADGPNLRGVVAWKAGDRDGARAHFLAALVRNPLHVDARANLAALAAGGEPRLALRPRVELPFGDRAALAIALDRFEARAATMAGVRAEVAAGLGALLTALGEGPTKDPARSRELARRPCPLTAVATRWAGVKAGRERFVALGLELEDAYAVIADHDRFGELAGGAARDRARVAEAHATYRAARKDVVELDAAIDRQVGRELTRRNCGADLLAAAAADPAAYRIPDERTWTPSVPPRTELPPTPATFVVDNRECAEPIAVYVDGDYLAEVAAGEQAAVAGAAGRRTVCLIPQPATAACGDRGTVREVDLADGWAVRMRCPRDR